jgi:flagellar biosynthetic protein FliR
MKELTGLVASNFDYTLLLFLRVSGLVLPSPVFGRRGTPSLIKICFCFFLSGLFLFAFPIPEAGFEHPTLISYIFACVKELMFGLAMGYVTTVFFDLVYSAGQLIDMQLGFGIVSVYDIQNNSQVPVIGNLLNIILLIVFFCVNGHLKLVSVLYATFEKVPVGHVMLSTDLAIAAMQAFSMSFVLAIMVAMPVLAAGLVLEIAMGVLIRSVPQMNMFVIGIPIKTLVGLIVLLVTIPAFVVFSNTIFNEMFKALNTVFGTFGVLK